MSLTSEDLLKYMEDELGIETNDVNGDTPLFGTGLMDSFSLVQMLTFIETRCEIRVNAVDVTPDNMDSINRILRYVEKRRDEDD